MHERDEYDAKERRHACTQPLCLTSTFVSCWFRVSLVLISKVGVSHTHTEQQRYRHQTNRKSATHIKG